MTDQKSKLDYLKKKYFGGPKLSKGNSLSTVENPSFAPSLDIFGDKDPDLPIVIEDPEGLLKTQKRGLTKSTWITVEEGKPDLEPPRKKRHDSDSEEEQKPAPKNAAAVETLRIDESGDIEPPRPKGKRPDRGIIEEVSERDRVQILQEPTKTVYREKGGRIISKEAAQTTKREELEKLNNEQLSKWGKGTRQLQQEQERAIYEAKVAKEPLRNTELTVETDEALKGVLRFGDPMKDFISQSKRVEPGIIAFKSKFKAPPNRYGIEPGHRWDGVDRGNGFEKKLLGSRNERISNEADAYRWRTEEM